MGNEIIPGLKLIHHNSSGVNLPDDTSFPFKLEGNFSPPEFMNVAFVLLYGGSEEIVVRAMTTEALYKFIETNRLLAHPRLRRMTITGPDGLVEEVKGRMG